MTPTSSIRAGIVGAAGYTGGELLRLLHVHPYVQVTSVASKTYAGRALYDAHPHLRGTTTQRFVPEVDIDDVDCLFLTGNHGVAMTQVPELLSASKGRLRIIDLSGDFRLREPALYEKWYGQPHTAAELLDDFVYGLSEVHADDIRAARLVANPGCFATAVALSLAPLARAGCTGAVHVTAMTGSSGSGAVPSSTTHHPTRAHDLHAYKPLAHQHQPEIEQLLDEAAGAASLRLAFVPVSTPVVRGIYAVSTLRLPSGWAADRVHDVFESYYADAPFVRLLAATPSQNAVVGSNFCDLFVAVERGQIAVIACLDNLVKGAAGQAIQNLNIMMGWRQTTGLLFPALLP